ncbi:MAG: pyridoxal 5'-phosphate synthase glutaminase subunit PdxT [Defluviitaleaceae bacterium]|nr:pyridoxal 5'-phosphate synthase glutaminase subunit PdxT [Defluviitaleaceae bacterium]
MKIGVLALQGAFIEHIRMFESLGVQTVEIRKLADFTEDLDGIVFPGGESTVMGKLLHELELMEPVKQALQKGLPAFGTCAGLILMAKKFVDSKFLHFQVLDVVVRRHGFGRQLGSFSAEHEFVGIGTYPMVFIRGPYITEVGQGVEVLAKIDDKIVAVRQGNLLGAAFHPELTDDTRVHEYFLKMVEEALR